jgi:hypothetical protein
LSFTYGLPLTKFFLGLNTAQVWLTQSTLQIRIFLASLGLVIFPVFVQAPLVRYWPWVSLAATSLWLALGWHLSRRPGWQVWGDLLIGFASIWLTGSLYWGWFRWEPVAHLPVEALGLPIALWCLQSNQGRVGSYFFLGSLLGTAVTDLYINWMDLFPVWRQLMESEPEFAPIILQGAATGLETDVAAGRAVILATFLLVATAISLGTSREPAWWAFSGAVFSTLLVDGLFFAGALLS